MRESYVIRPLGVDDRAQWERLARGYKAFYETALPDHDYECAWRRLMGGADFRGLCASDGGALLGISHHLFHDNLWLDRVCYLQDLFTAPEHRGRGVARALIAAAADDARHHGAARLYWQTKQDNLTARAMYDRIAAFHGFIRYDYPL
jgi:GNAT superfamily N-acetyltransferase